MKTPTIIFDMDGVILDSERVYQEIERGMYEELGIQVSRDEQLQFMGTSELLMWTTICERYQVSRKVEDLGREERERFIARLDIPGSIPLMEGIIPLLESLKLEQVPCWIASSSYREIIDRVLEVNDLLSYFNGFVGGDEVDSSKPSPEIYLKTASLAGTVPSQCVVIEDSKNGVLAARAAGMTVIALHVPVNDQTNSSIRERPVFHEASLIVNSLTELNADSLIRLVAI